MWFKKKEITKKKYKFIMSSGRKITGVVVRLQNDWFIVNVESDGVTRQLAINRNNIDYFIEVLEIVGGQENGN